MIRLAAAALLLTVWAQSAEPASFVDVTVTGVRNDAGHVRVAVCTRHDFLQPFCEHNASVRARAGSVTVRVPNVPPGAYAVQAWHDENDNGKIDTNFLGIPREGIGFSRDAPFRFGPPSFSDAAFRLGPDGGAVALKLRYFG
jgi:uncharacterized protein (DUF2141 family)